MMEKLCDKTERLPMTIVDMLRANAEKYPDEVALVEVNPEMRENRHITWREYDLVETTDDEPFRREMTWSVFDEKANRFANLLLSRGVHKDDKVAILLYNCIEWLPLYFGVLKSSATVVPLNFRYSAEEIAYCVDKADVDILVFGPEFIGRVEEIAERIQQGRLLFYVGDDCPTWAESYRELASLCSSADPRVLLSEDEDAAIYFSSGTTGFPKAILHHHQSLTQAAEMGAAPPRADPRRRVPLHPAALPHRRLHALAGGACSWAGAACSCAACPPRRCSRPSPTRAAPSCGCFVTLGAGHPRGARGGHG